MTIGITIVITVCVVLPAFAICYPSKPLEDEHSSSAVTVNPECEAPQEIIDIAIEHLSHYGQQEILSFKRVVPPKSTLLRYVPIVVALIFLTISCIPFFWIDIEFLLIDRFILTCLLLCGGLMLALVPGILATIYYVFDTYRDVWLVISSRRLSTIHKNNGLLFGGPKYALSLSTDWHDGFLYSQKSTLCMARSW